VERLGRERFVVEAREVAVGLVAGDGGAETRGGGEAHTPPTFVGEDAVDGVAEFVEGEEAAVDVDFRGGVSGAEAANSGDEAGAQGGRACGIGGRDAINGVGGIEEKTVEAAAHGGSGEVVDENSAQRGSVRSKRSEFRVVLRPASGRPRARAAPR